MTNAMATTNSGSDVTARATTELAWSNSESLRSAASAPRATPTMLPMAPASATSTAELTRAGPTRLQTGLPLARLLPGWPVRTPPIHDPY